MTVKVFGAIAGIAALIILALAAPAIPDAVESFRTDTLTQDYTVATGVGVTTASVALSHSLWNDSVSYVTRVASTITGDSLVADNYTAASRALALSGLSANTSRVISVDYRTDGLGDNPAASTGSTYFPAVFILFLVLIPLAFGVYLFSG